MNDFNCHSFMLLTINRKFASNCDLFKKKMTKILTHLEKSAAKLLEKKNDL